MSARKLLCAAACWVAFWTIVEAWEEGIAGFAYAVGAWLESRGWA